VPEGDLVVALLYPEVLGSYGDGGNATALVHRGAARGLDVRVVEVGLGTTAPAADVYLLGGGEDSAQLLALEAARRDPHLTTTLADGATCLAVCAGLQLLCGEFTGPDGRVHAGLGLLDATSGRLAERAVGEVVADPVGLPGLPPLSGYENHLGTAVPGPDARPLGRVRAGTGNGPGPDGVRHEGVVQGGVVATYLHGPVLVRNPALADLLLERTTGPLPAYDDALVEQLRTEWLAAARRRRG